MIAIFLTRVSEPSSKVSDHKTRQCRPAAQDRNNTRYVWSLILPRGHSLRWHSNQERRLLAHGEAAEQEARRPCKAVWFACKGTIDWVCCVQQCARKQRTRAVIPLTPQKPATVCVMPGGMTTFSPASRHIQNVGESGRVLFLDIGLCHLADFSRGS